MGVFSGYRRQQWRRINLFSWLSLITLVLILSFATAYFLRQNNVHMRDLRDQLVAADKSGDAAQVQQAARKLQNYVSAHMNTATGRVGFATLYKRDADAAMEKSKPPEIDSSLYQKATEDCKPQFANYGYEAWASCVATKVNVNPSATLNIADNVSPDRDLYYVEYVSPVWSFDLAGVSLVLLILVVIIIILKALWLVIEGATIWLRDNFMAYGM